MFPVLSGIGCGCRYKLYGVGSGPFHASPCQAHGHASSRFGDRPAGPTVEPCLTAGKANAGQNEQTATDVVDGQGFAEKDDRESNAHERLDVVIDGAMPSLEVGQAISTKQERQGRAGLPGSVLTAVATVSMRP